MPCNPSLSPRRSLSLLSLTASLHRWPTRLAHSASTLYYSLIQPYSGTLLAPATLHASEGAQSAALPASGVLRGATLAIPCRVLPREQRTHLQPCFAKKKWSNLSGRARLRADRIGAPSAPACASAVDPGRPGCVQTHCKLKAKSITSMLRARQGWGIRLQARRAQPGAPGVNKYPRVNIQTRSL